MACKNCAFFVKETNRVEGTGSEVSTFGSVTNQEDGQSYCLARCGNELTQNSGIVRHESTAFVFSEGGLLELVDQLTISVAGENDSCPNFQQKEV